VAFGRNESKSAARDVFEIDEGLTLEEALPGKRDMAFYGRFVFRMVGASRIGEVSPEGGILE
jgi:hypothetical protein